MELKRCEPGPRFIATAWVLLAMPAAAERINQEGRILGALPVVTNAILFNTTNADAVVSAMQIFPSPTRGTKSFPTGPC